MQPAAHTVTLAGLDAVAFAQAQFSSAVSALEPGQWQWSAWLDARARVRALFHLLRVGEKELLMLLRGGDAGALAAELRRFVFRSRVTITANAPQAIGTGAAHPLHGVSALAQGLALGCGDHSLVITADGPGNDGWILQQIRIGWPWLPDSALDRWLAPALSLHRLQATVLGKGCYPGQEIIARLHFKGSHKRHLCHVVLTHAIGAGDDLYAGGRAVGSILLPTAARGMFEALAVLEDARGTEALNGRPDGLANEPTGRVIRQWPS